MGIADIDIQTEDLQEQEEQSKELVIQQQIDQVIAEIAKREVTNNEEYTFAAQWLKKNKDTQKYVEQQFEDELEEAKEKKRQAENERKAVVKKIDQFNKPLKEAEKSTRKMLESYQAELDRKRREEEQKRREEEEKRRKESADSTEVAPEPEPAVVEEAEPPKVDGVSYYERWTYEIEDESQIPREFLMVDEKKIRGYVQSMKGDGSIPGVKIYSEKKTRVQ